MANDYKRLRGAAPSQAANRARSGGGAAATAASGGAHIGSFCDQLTLEDGLAPSSLATVRRRPTDVSAGLGKGVSAPVGAARGDLGRGLADQFEAMAEATSVARRLWARRRFYRVQLAQGTIAESPTQRVRAPKRPRKLPKQLSEAQVETLL